MIKYRFKLKDKWQGKRQGQSKARQRSDAKTLCLASKKGHRTAAVCPIRCSYQSSFDKK